MSGSSKPAAESKPALLKVFSGKGPATPPIWLMRQAGRYLPEYREVRTKAGSFLDLCFNPELATEVTLQPIRRYSFDAAIIFSDILVVPWALGQPVRFVEGEGPRLDPVTTAEAMARLRLEGLTERLAPVYEAIARTRAALPKETALIGFCGAPWTVATYMVAGQGTTDQAPARLWAYRDRAGFQKLIDLLVDASVAHLSAQIEAGADLVQIFDTWAGSLAEQEWWDWCFEPTRRIVRGLKMRYPNTPVIGFPRGTDSMLLSVFGDSGVDGMSVSHAVPLKIIKEELAGQTVVQGNLDPLILVAGGARLDEAVDHIVGALSPHRFIFNLGHGIVPQTPPEHVKQLVDRVRRGGGRHV